MQTKFDYIIAYLLILPLIALSIWSMYPLAKNAIMYAFFIIDTDNKYIFQGIQHFIHFDTTHFVGALINQQFWFAFFDSFMLAILISSIACIISICLSLFIVYSRIDIFIPLVFCVFFALYPNSVTLYWFKNLLLVVFVDDTQWLQRFAYSVSLIWQLCCIMTIILYIKSYRIFLHSKDTYLLENTSWWQLLSKIHIPHLHLAIPWVWGLGVLYIVWALPIHTDIETIGKYMFGLIEQGNFPAASALAICLIGLTAIFVYAIHFLTKIRF